MTAGTQALAKATQQHGFVLREFGELLNWKTAPIFDRELEHIEHCPTDGQPMRPLASLVSQSCDERIDIGHCEQCGHVCYMDRPSEASIREFYREQWMGDTPARARECARELAGQYDAVFARLLQPFINPSLPALEIGCGYGNATATLRAAGCKTLVGVEACPIRAKAVREMHGIEVVDGEFLEVPFDHLRFGFIWCYHVLEHCSDIDGFVSRCAALQRPGDRLIVGAPSFCIEPKMAVLLFWPHLHSFSQGSLETLFARHGYVCERRVSEDTADLLCLFRKVDCEVAPPQPIRWTFERASRALAPPAEIGDGTIRWRRPQGDAMRSAAISAIADYQTDSPIEIQFTGRVEMAHK